MKPSELEKYVCDPKRKIWGKNFSCRHCLPNECKHPLKRSEKNEV